MEYGKRENINQSEFSNVKSEVNNVNEVCNISKNVGLSVKNLTLDNKQNIQGSKIKKKKKSYKNFMNDIIQSTRTIEEAHEEQKKKIVRSTGGGNFNLGNLEKI